MSIAANEFAVIAKVAEELSVLNKGEIRRAINWLSDYFGIYEDELDEAAVVALTTPLLEAANESLADEIADDEVDEQEEQPDTFATFFGQVAPKTAIEKAVTAAYWLEKREGATSWKSFEVNKLLRSIGIKLSSISGTLAIDEKKDVPYVEQLAKSGDSMQARKTFALSEAGVAFVEGRL